MNYTYLFAFEPTLQSLKEMYLVFVIIVIEDIVFEKESHYVDQAYLKLTMIQLPLPLKYWQ